MSGALERRTVDPSRGEAEGIELGAEHVADAAHAREVHRAAVDVDDALEQRQRARVVRVDVTNDRTLVGGKRCGRLRDGA